MGNGGIELTEDIFTNLSDEAFREAAIRIFQYQYRQNPVYGDFCRALSRSPGNVNAITDIPFLPVTFFRDHEVVCNPMVPEALFLSSGTTGQLRSRHAVADLSRYRTSLTEGFRLQYGEPSGYHFYALTPKPEEAPHSSLVYMIGELMKASRQASRDFLLDDPARLARELTGYSGTMPGHTPDHPRPFVIGLTWALLEFAERFPGSYHHTIFLETGGMKGRRKEITREELHGLLSAQLGVSEIHSEYGMTELLSQAWSKGDGIFIPPPWMKILIRESTDPLNFLPSGRDGGISVIDLANIHSCSFLATQDLGRLHPNGSFEVLGRFDEAEVRGCSLMMS